MKTIRWLLPLALLAVPLPSPARPTDDFFHSRRLPPTAADRHPEVPSLVAAATAGPAPRAAGDPIAPVISAQPRGATVNARSTVALTVAASGDPTPAFQWRKDHVPLPGATTDTLVLGALTAAHAGTYTVVLSNPAGAVVSAPALLRVTTGQPSRLRNLAVRTHLGPAQTLTVGFATLGSKTMLVRAIGPALAAFGLRDLLPDPAIALFDATAAKIDENNDWNPALAHLFVDVGAFALTSGSTDAALLRACNGSHTAHIAGPGTGVVLVEIYDVGGPGLLVNAAARNLVGTGENLLLAGFVVDGTAAKTLLIRGVGAKLAEFGVTGVLADPKLEIYDSTGAKIAENDSWNVQLQPLARSAGAFDLTPGSRDAALLLTLAPGPYTAQISGVGATTGQTLLELYDVP